MSYFLLTSYSGALIKALFLSKFDLIFLKADNQKLSEQIDELTRSNQELTVIVSQLSDDIQNQPR